MVALEQRSAFTTIVKDEEVALGLSQMDIANGLNQFRVICGYPRATDLATFTAGAEPRKNGNNILKLVYPSYSDLQLVKVA